MKIDGEKLQQYRLEKFLDKSEVAEASGLNVATIARLEGGEFAGHSRPSTVRRLADALGVRPYELLEGDYETLGGGDA